MPLKFSLHQLFNPSNVRLGQAITFCHFLFYLKSWWPSRFPSSSYLIHQIFACRPSLFSSFPILLLVVLVLVFDCLFTPCANMFPTCQIHMQAPLGLKKLQTPPGNSYAYYCRPPLAEGQGGVWELQAHAAPTWGRRPRTPTDISIELIILFIYSFVPNTRPD